MHHLDHELNKPFVEGNRSGGKRLKVSVGGNEAQA
jgi:hypothetical protein